jgi:hypothetical protein
VCGVEAALGLDETEKTDGVEIIDVKVGGEAGSHAVYDGADERHVSFEDFLLAGLRSFSIGTPCGRILFSVGPWSGHDGFDDLGHGQAAGWAGASGVLSGGGESGMEDLSSSRSLVFSATTCLAQYSMTNRKTLKSKAVSTQPMVALKTDASRFLFAKRLTRKARTKPVKPPMSVKYCMWADEISGSAQIVAIFAPKKEIEKMGSEL